MAYSAILERFRTCNAEVSKRNRFGSVSEWPTTHDFIVGWHEWKCPGQSLLRFARFSPKWLTGRAYNHYSYQNRDILGLWPRALAV